mmetsp:Transcript_39954/g.128102  ORF Transcript_39954/g.128102 Transcript_39954/m.128102 type:complete len:225 (+) Transcript_39954:1323-1997(+)
MAPRIVATIASAVRCVCQKSSREAACSPASSLIADARNFCQCDRSSTVATKPRTAGSSALSVGSHGVLRSTDSAVLMPSHVSSTSLWSSISSSGMRLKRLRTNRLPATERRSNEVAERPAVLCTSAAKSTNESKSPVPIPPRKPPSTAPETCEEPNCRLSASCCISPKISKARTTSEAPTEHASVSGDSPSALRSSETDTERLLACNLSKTMSTQSKLPLCAAR